MSKRSENVEEQAAATEAEAQVTVEDNEAQAASAELSEAEKLMTQVAEKDKELAELKDKYLRTVADFDNARKRLRQQGEETARLQRENLLRDILPVVDNLERAVAASKGGGNGKSIVEGVEMVLQSMIEFLRGQGVSPLTAVGQPFDPQRHEAMDQVESETHPANMVVSEFHRGYLIGERMLRPARVTVAKSASPKPEEGKPQS